MMKPRIETLDTKKLVGFRLKMSLVQNRTTELWRTFMQRQEEVMRRVGSHIVSMQVYNRALGDPFSPETPFEKWAAVEVSEQDEVPAGMEAVTLAGGKYAVFTHRGPASAASSTFQKIFGVWLPNSGYALDAREHFEIFPAGYRPDDPAGEEA